jgi:hypothetical protein
MMANLKAVALSLWRNPRYGWAVKLFGAIGVAIIGNAVWEFAAKPLGLAVFRTVLSSTSAWVSDYRNDFYVRAARGFHESSDLVVLPLLGFALIISGVAYWASTYGSLRRNQKQVGELRERVSRLRNNSRPVTEAISTEAELADIDRELTRAEKQLVVGQRMKFWVLAGILWWVFSIGSDIVKTYYANTLVTYFEQLHRISLPYISVEEEKSLLSSFARINSRDRFIKVIRNAEGYARRSGETIPTVDPW